MPTLRLPTSEALPDRFREALAAVAPGIAALKEHIVERLLAWEQELNGFALNNGTFVLEGIRQRLQQLTPAHMQEQVQITSFGDVVLCDDVGDTCVGKIWHPDDGGDWASREFVNRMTLHSGISVPTFQPYGANRYTDPAQATPDGPGAFQLSLEHVASAQAAMAAHAALTYLEVAATIQGAEQPSEYRGLRVTRNLQYFNQAMECVLAAHAAMVAE